MGLSLATAFIALGGNMGDVQANFIAARNKINALPHTSLTASSLLYRSPAIGPSGQADYLNAVLAFVTTMQPLPLLDALQHIEHGLGRVRNEHWGPRTLDLDLLAIDSLIIKSDRLILPHIQLHKRQFVLRPLCDIAPEWRHPALNKTSSLLLQEQLQRGEPALPKGIVW